MSTKTLDATMLDIRVRERNLKSGMLTEADVAKVVADLPDLADQVDSFSTPQPAFSVPVDVDDSDDEDDDGDR